MTNYIKNDEQKDQNQLKLNYFDKNGPDSNRRDKFYGFRQRFRIEKVD